MPEAPPVTMITLPLMSMAACPFEWAVARSVRRACPQYAAALRGVEINAQRQIDEAVATTLREAAPDPNEEDWCALATRHLSEASHAE